MKKNLGISLHQYLSFSKIFSYYPKIKVDYIYYPGCSQAGYDSDLLVELIKYLEEKLEQKIGVVLSCCGKPSLINKDKNKAQEKLELTKLRLDNLGAKYLIVGCQSCYKTLKGQINQEVISLWELIPRLGIPNKNLNNIEIKERIFNIHDSCSSRDEVCIQDGIRKILKDLGFKIEEIEKSREKTRCCGNIAMTNKNKLEELKTLRLSDFTKKDLISYCGACTEIFRNSDYNSYYILDLLFGDLKDKKNISLLKKWKIRYNSKQKIKNYP